MTRSKVPDRGITMKIRPISYTFLVATLYVACVLPRAACDRQTIHDGVDVKPEELNPSQENPLLYGGVITSEDQAVNTVYRGFFDELAAVPRKTADQVSTIPRATNEDLGEKLPLDVYLGSEAVGSEQNGEENRSAGPRKLNRRSVVALETGGDKDRRGTLAPDSGFTKQPFNPNDKLSPDPRAEPPSSFPAADRGESQRSTVHSGEQGDAASINNAEGNSHEPGFQIVLQGRVEDPISYRTIFSNQHSVNIPGLLRNGPREDFRFGLPGQPIRRIVNFVLDRLAVPRPTHFEVDQGNGRLPRRLFDHGRGVVSNAKENLESTGAGIHRAVKLGPLSVSVDVGRQ